MARHSSATACFVHSGAHSPPHLRSPLLSCPFVLCSVAGPDVRADETRRKGKYKVIYQNPSPASGALRRERALRPHAPLPRARPRDPDPATAVPTT